MPVLQVIGGIGSGSLSECPLPGGCSQALPIAARLGTLTVTLPSSWWAPLTTSGSWALKVPNSASFRLDSADKTYVGCKRSFAWQKPEGVAIFKRAKWSRPKSGLRQCLCDEWFQAALVQDPWTALRVVGGTTSSKSFCAGKRTFRFRPQNGHDIESDRDFLLARLVAVPFALNCAAANFTPGFLQLKQMQSRAINHSGLAPACKLKWSVCWTPAPM